MASTQSIDTRTCSRCKECLPIASFSRNATRKDGLQSQCKSCSKKSNREWYDRHADKQRARSAEIRSRPGFSAQTHASYIRRTYGIDAEEYGRLLASQGGGCAICLAPACTTGRRLSVDHCHTTGAVRGLLCQPCNSGLGQYRDSPALLREAALYLENHR